MTISTETEIETKTKPTRVSPRDKAAATDDAAWSIINAEAAERERKTEALRAARLKLEAEAPAAEEKKVRKTPVRRTVARSRSQR
ncbi:hypothetical protein J5J10_11995 [Ciceribacter sp. L1K23]|uniref:hypothetical protein n=1 Tax=Ciceribacter sp. L1K23 TaxID=2820276 RepID=UPI001B82F9BF|nr:hypothetical protein [Ciceribacter sp. L1K23]MBR0556401.1 hypothetical protein [Ciceribacter sp. L1K23]